MATLQQKLGLISADIKDRAGTLLVYQKVLVTDQETGSPVRIYATRELTSPVALGEVTTNSSGRVSFYAIKGRAILLQAMMPNGEILAEVSGLRPDAWGMLAGNTVGPEGPPGPDEATALRDALEASVDAAAAIQAILDDWADEYVDDDRRNRELDLRGANVMLKRPLTLSTEAYSSIKIRNGHLYADITANWGTEGGQPAKSLIELRGAVQGFRLEEVELACLGSANGFLNNSTGNEHYITKCHINGFASWGVEDPQGGLSLDTATVIEQVIPSEVVVLDSQENRTGVSVMLAGADSVIDKATLQTARWPLKLGFDWSLVGNFTLGNNLIQDVRGQSVATTVSGSDILEVPSIEPFRVGMVLSGSVKLQIGSVVTRILNTTHVQIDKTAVANGSTTVEFDGANLVYPGTLIDAPGIAADGVLVDAVVGTRIVRMTEVAVAGGTNTPISARKGAVRPRVMATGILNLGPTSSPVSNMGSFYVGRETQGALLYGCRTSRAMAEIWSTSLAMVDHVYEDDPLQTSTPAALFQLKASSVSQTLEGFTFRHSNAFTLPSGSTLFSMTAGLPGSSWSIAGISGLANTVAEIEHSRTSISGSDLIWAMKTLQAQGKLTMAAQGTTVPVEIEVKGNNLRLLADQIDMQGAVLKDQLRTVSEIDVNTTLDATQSSAILVGTNTTAKTWQLPNTLPKGWHVHILRSAAGTISLVPAGGALLDGELTGQNVEAAMSVSCISNADGESAVFTTAFT